MTGPSSTFVVRRPFELADVEIFMGNSSEPSSLRHLHEDYRFGMSVVGAWETRYRGENRTVGFGQVQLAQPGETSSCEFSPGQFRAFIGVTVTVDRVSELNT